MEKIRILLREDNDRVSSGIIDEIITDPDNTQGILFDNTFKVEILGKNAYSRLGAIFIATNGMKIRTFISDSDLLYLIRCGTISHNITKKYIKIECVNHERLIKYIR